MRYLCLRKIVLMLLCSSVTFNGFSQTELTQIKNAAFQKISEFEEKSELVHSDSTSIVWHQIDTFMFVRYTSAIIDVPHHDTLKIALRFESGWSDSALMATKENNTRLINKHRVKFSHHMDSIKWRGYKISKQWFELEPVLFLKMNYPRVFSEQESAEIEQIRRCPDYRMDSIGVFLDCNHTGIDPPEIERKFMEKLRFISEDVFEAEEIVYGVKVYE